MTTLYPGSLDVFTAKTDGVDYNLAAHINDLQDAVAAVEGELGTDPAGSYATVAARLADGGAADIHAATSKATPVDADEIGMWDSVATALKKLTWANIKATLWTTWGALIAAGTSKATPVDADKIALSDSAASNATKYLTWANIKATLWTTWGALVAAGTSKATPVDADKITLSDSAASDATKYLTWANLKATLKAYFDTLYQTTHKNILLGTGDNGTIPASTTYYGVVGKTGLASSSVVGFPMPNPGTIRKFYVRLGTTQPASGDLVITVRKNGGNQSVTITIAAGAVGATYSDTSNSFTVAAGDVVDIQFVNNATGASGAIRGFSLEYEYA